MLYQGFRYYRTLKNLQQQIQLSVQHQQVGPLSQAIRAAACLSLGQNITAKSVHLTPLYPTALTSTNDHLSVLRHYGCT